MPFAEKKRFIQSEARRIRNHASKSRVKTLMKRVSNALEVGDAAATKSQLRNAISVIQKAGRKRILHPNTAARRISQLSKMVQRRAASTLSRES